MMGLRMGIFCMAAAVSSGCNLAMLRKCGTDFRMDDVIYVVVGTNTNNCPTGMSRVRHGDCEAAAKKLGLQYDRPTFFQQGSYPAGCYKEKDGNKVWSNSGCGGAHAEYAIICQAASANSVCPALGTFSDCVAKMAKDCPPTQATNCGPGDSNCAVNAQLQKALSQHCAKDGLCNGSAECSGEGATCTTSHEEDERLKKECSSAQLEKDEEAFEAKLRERLSAGCRAAMQAAKVAGKDTFDEDGSCTDIAVSCESEETSNLEVTCSGDTSECDSGVPSQWIREQNAKSKDIKKRSRCLYKECANDADIDLSLEAMKADHARKAKCVTKDAAGSVCKAKLGVTGTPSVSLKCPNVNKHVGSIHIAIGSGSTNTGGTDKKAGLGISLTLSSGALSMKALSLPSLFVVVWTSLWL